MEALETAAKEVALRAAAKSIESSLNEDHSDFFGPHLVSPCGHLSQYLGRRKKTFVTVVGAIHLKRAYYHCSECGSGWCPRDVMLGFVGHQSPGVQRLVAYLAEKEAFIPAGDTLKVVGGINVSARDVERSAEATGQDMIEKRKRADAETLTAPFEIYSQGEPIPILYVQTDGTGVPVTKKEMEGRKGKQPDGSGKTREAKTGAVFTQTTTDADGFPLRDAASTSYLGSIETAEEFGPKLFAEAIRRGLYRSAKTVFIGDGALWIWGLATLYFPGAIEIVDIYHARERLHELLAELHPEKGEFFEERKSRWLDWLDAGLIENIMKESMRLLPEEGKRRDSLITQIEYYDRNKNRMRYAEFRAQGLFIGSGVIEGCCKSIVSNRMKKSGARWTVKDANKIIALRCTKASNQWEDYWQGRVAA